MAVNPLLQYLGGLNQAGTLGDAQEAQRQFDLLQILQDQGRKEVSLPPVSRKAKVLSILGDALMAMGRRQPRFVGSILAQREAELARLNRQAEGDFQFERALRAQRQGEASRAVRRGMREERRFQRGRQLEAEQLAREEEQAASKFEEMVAIESGGLPPDLRPQITPEMSRRDVLFALSKAKGEYARRQGREEQAKLDTKELEVQRQQAENLIQKYVLGNDEPDFKLPPLEERLKTTSKEQILREFRWRVRVFVRDSAMVEAYVEDLADEIDRVQQEGPPVDTGGGTDVAAALVGADPSLAATAAMGGGPNAVAARLRDKMVSGATNALETILGVLQEDQTRTSPSAFFGGPTAVADSVGKTLGQAALVQSGLGDDAQLLQILSDLSKLPPELQEFMKVRPLQGGRMPWEKERMTRDAWVEANADPRILQFYKRSAEEARDRIARRLARLAQ